MQELADNPAFSGSRRRQAFLRYVVEETLAGRGESIKETNIAVDVFERSSDFDTQSDSIVRVTGGEVRKRLAQAYASGLKHDLRIELPVGSYQPLFHFLPEPIPASLAELGPTSKAGSTRSWLIGSLAVLAVAAVVGYSYLAGEPTSSIDSVWKPYVNKDQPVLISMMAPHLLTVSDPQKWLPIRPGTFVPSSALVEMDAAFVGTGGALGAALFVEQLAFREQPFLIKFGNDLSFADLKNSPAILIGASRWTRELTQNLRFRMDVDRGIFVIRDSQRPDRTWGIAPGSRMERAEGYSLITRLMRSESGHPILIIEGMDPRNTQAAVEFLSRTGKFDQFAAGASAGWENSNFQVVLRSTIHGNSPGSLEVATSHIW